MTELTPPNVQIPEAAWQWVRENLPIACVDVLPVIRDEQGKITKVGLIWRDSPMGQRWCHVGGRLLYQESLHDGAVRHLIQSLNQGAVAAIGDQPFFVNQFFPARRAGMGLDPRKHAVATCYIAEFPEGTLVTATGLEALDFKWFSQESLPAEEARWPGLSLMLDRIKLEPAWSNELVTYSALNDRCISHDELMWQTPALAMTAMAFLLTIALGGDAPDAARTVAAWLSATVAVVSLQLMVKHSIHQLADADELWRIEVRRGMLQVHAKPSRSARFGLRNLRTYLATRRSRIWWQYALLIFALVSVGVGVESAIDVWR